MPIPPRNQSIFESSISIKVSSCRSHQTRIVNTNRIIVENYLQWKSIFDKYQGVFLFVLIRLEQFTLTG